MHTCERTNDWEHVLISRRGSLHFAFPDTLEKRYLLYQTVLFSAHFSLYPPVFAGRRQRWSPGTPIVCKTREINGCWKESSPLSRQIVRESGWFFVDGARERVREEGGGLTFSGKFAAFFLRTFINKWKQFWFCKWIKILQIIKVCMPRWRSRQCGRVRTFNLLSR